MDVLARSRLPGGILAVRVAVRVAVLVSVSVIVLVPILVVVLVPFPCQTLSPLLLALGVCGSTDGLVWLEAGSETTADGCC